MKLNIHLLLCSKRHYIDEIEYPPSPICGEKPQFESNVTSFQFRQNASARWWPIGHHLASAFWRGKWVTGASTREGLKSQKMGDVMYGWPLLKKKVYATKEVFLCDLINKRRKVNTC